MSYQRRLITGIPRGQNWGCFSFLRSKDDTTISVVGVRLAGVYMTFEEADLRAKEVQAEDNRFNVFVGELNGDFLPFDPSPTSPAAGTSEYADKQLDAIMKGHDDSQKKAQLHHELRKTEKMIGNINDNLKAQHENKEELTHKLTKAKTLDEIKSITGGLDNIEVQIKKMEERLKDCTLNESKLRQQTMGASPPAEE